MNEQRFPTLAVHGGEQPDPATGALDPPVVLATTFAFDSAEDARARFAGERDGYIYSRWRNPTVDALERKVAALECAEQAVALASGMAAVYGAVTSVVSAGDHVVAPVSIYAETAKLLREHLARFGVETTFVDMTDAALARAAMRPRTRLVWAESPANPTLAVADLAALATVAHDANALLVVDNTFATPYHQRPLSLGADLVVHAATKALCGHGDAVGGIVAGSGKLCEAVRRDAVRSVGAALSPFNAFLIARGARTLALRARQSSASAMTLATRLASDRRVERVHYPGLTSHPGHAVAVRQMHDGFGGLVAFEARGGVEAGRRCYDRVGVIARAVSLGDVRSLLTHPATTTHASMPADARRAGGIGDGLLRLSVGIEDVEDLWEDLDRALAG